MTEETNAESGRQAPPPVPPVTSSPTVPPTSPTPQPPTVPPPAQAPPQPPAPSAPEPPSPDGPGRRSGVTAGIVLILVGIGLLLAQFVPGLSLWQLWPLFVIVPGIVQCFVPGKDGWSVQQFLDGLVTVTVGFILLANTTGYLSWGVWWEIVQLWPVLLISAGLGILGRATNQGWLRVVGTLVVLVAFAYAVSVSYYVVATPRWVGAPGGESFSFTSPVAGGQDASISIESGVGEIALGGTTARSVTVEGVSPFGPPDFSANSAGGTTNVVFKLTEQTGFISYPGAPTARVDARLSDAAPWDVRLETGVSSLDADLSEVEVNSLVLETGVSSSTIRLGDAPDGPEEGRVDVESGVASVKILVPKDSQVRVESDSGLTAHQIDPALVPLGGRTWETSGFSAAQQAGDPVWRITASSGIGSVVVATY